MSDAAASMNESMRVESRLTESVMTQAPNFTRINTAATATEA